jgi:hypothetical protein
MPLVLSGTNGVSGVDGTASNPSYEGTDSNTGIFFPAADTIAFSEGGVEVGRFDSSANFQFNSGYGSVATAYGCRAWVNFDGTANTNLSGTYSQSGTTVTVTATAHGLLAGNVVYSDITTGTAVDGTYTVATVVNANSFTYTAGTSLTTSGNITLLRNTIRASGNVSSVADNGTGTYTVNLANAMPDANYSVVLGMNSATDGSFIKLGKSAGIGVPTTSAFQVNTTNFSAVYTDYPGVFAAIFR